jgi:hypothetical protein
LTDRRDHLDRCRLSHTLRPLALPCQRSSEALQTTVALKLHDPGRQRPTLGSLNARVAQLERLANLGDSSRQAIREIRPLVRKILVGRRPEPTAFL